MCKAAKKEAKKVAHDAKYKAYDDLYTRLGTREGYFKVCKNKRKDK